MGRTPSQNHNCLVHTVVPVPYSSYQGLLSFITGNICLILYSTSVFFNVSPLDVITRLKLVIIACCIQTSQPDNKELSQHVHPPPPSNSYSGNYILYSPKYKPTPSLTFNFRHRYFYLLYKPLLQCFKNCTISKNEHLAGDQQHTMLLFVAYLFCQLFLLNTLAKARKYAQKVHWMAAMAYCLLISRSRPA